MKNKRLLTLLGLTLSLVTYSCSAQETESKKQNLEFVSSDLKEVDFPKPIGYVNDFENLFTAEQVKKLTEVITLYEQKTTNEIAVITIDSIEPYSDFNQYAVDLSKSWGVGKSGKNNGLTIVFSSSLKNIRISTGTGTEKILTDELCKSIIDQFMVPKFKEGQYYEGIAIGLAELMKQWK
ncbi:TPM domain-containing protein [Botryobacter ruber]|uniref:TPM domain-containing protein n=1 Tax=Botryobacter ruber TaxID=2171629 RepID=UPI000E0B1C63|nr:TPM domain-containing protein [Botryobacter ruber]